MLDAVLEGYPKKKKDLYVSTYIFCCWYLTNEYSNMKGIKTLNNCTFIKRLLSVTVYDFINVLFVYE